MTSQLCECGHSKEVHLDGDIPVSPQIGCASVPTKAAWVVVQVGLRAIANQPLAPT